MTGKEDYELERLLCEKAKLESRQNPSGLMFTIEKLYDELNSLKSEINGLVDICSKYEEEHQRLEEVLKSIITYPPFEYTNQGDRFYSQMQDIARQALAKKRKDISKRLSR